MPRLLTLTIVATLLVGSKGPAAAQRCAGSFNGPQPALGIVRDQRTAETVAYAYLRHIYGEKNLRDQMPLRASLADGIWYVTGTLPRGVLGGTATISICKNNGQVLAIIHMK